MRNLLEMVLNGRSVEKMLNDEARAIKALGESNERKTFAPQKEYGFVTGKSIPVPIPVRKRA